MNWNNWNNYDVEKKNEEIENGDANFCNYLTTNHIIIYLFVFVFFFFLWLERWNSWDASVQRNRAHRSSADDEKVDKNQENQISKQIWKRQWTLGITHLSLRNENLSILFQPPSFLADLWNSAQSTECSFYFIIFNSNPTSVKFSRKNSVYFFFLVFSVFFNILLKR